MPKKVASKARRREMAIDKASDLVAAGVPFNNDSLSDDVRIAAAVKMKKAGKVSTMGRRRRRSGSY